MGWNRKRKEKKNRSHPMLDVPCPCTTFFVQNCNLFSHLSNQMKVCYVCIVFTRRIFSLETKDLDYNNHNPQSSNKSKFIRMFKIGQQWRIVYYFVFLHAILKSLFIHVINTNLISLFIHYY